MKNLNICIIGAGKVGTALTIALKKAKYNISCIVDTNIKNANQLAKKINVELVFKNHKQIPSDVNLFIIAV